MVQRNLKRKVQAMERSMGMAGPQRKRQRGPQQRKQQKRVVLRNRQGKVKSFGPQRPRGFGRPQAAPVAFAREAISSVPQIRASHDQCHVVHRELLSSIVGSVNFAVPFSYALNPGLPASFPWLSTMAQNWETYRFNKLRYIALTRTGTSTPGSLMLVPDYDASDAAPSTEIVASSYEDVVEDAPWHDIVSHLRPSAMFPEGPKKYIRVGAAPVNTDIKTYDAGNFFVCTTDGTAVNWAKLWVEYDVTLFTPQLPPGGSAALQSQHVTGTSITTASLFANPVTIAGSSSIVTISGDVLTFVAQGRYFLSLNLAGGTATQSSPPVVSASGSFVLTYGNTSGYADMGNTTSVFNYNMLVNAVVGTTITFAVTMVSGTLMELFIASVPLNQA